MKKLSIDKKNIPQICFVVAVLLALILPVCFFNFKKDQISKIENKRLADWPDFETSEDILGDIESYVDDRIGFRDAAIEFYTEANNSLFDVMVHPLFMWGEDDHIFYKDKDYIAAYQRINTDEEYLDSMVEFLEKTNDYLSEKGIEFLYFVCPDKKTIYSEYFPKTVNVNYANQSVLEYLDEKLAETDVDYINPKDTLLAAKEVQVVYNKKYDATHWNDAGGFVAETLIDDYIQTKFDDVPKLDINNFDISTVTMESLDNAKFEINEDVPLFTLREDYTADYTELLKLDLDFSTDNFYTHHINTTAPNDRRLLVFTDSYLQAHQKYYDNRFKEVYFVHRQNYDYLQYFVNLVFPDMVIFETAERSISSEMPLNTDFTDYYYEPDYKGDYNFVENSDLSYKVLSTKGAMVSGNTIYIDPEDTTSIMRIDCVLYNDSDDEYNVYVATDDECMETDYCKYHRESEIIGIQRFSINIQRRYVAQYSIKLFAQNARTGETVLLDTLEVKYNG